MQKSSMRESLRTVSESWDALPLPRWPVSCCQVPERAGVWMHAVFVPASAMCFLFLLHTILVNESRMAAWISFLPATAISICWVSCLFSTKLLCLGSNLPGSDKVQKKTRFLLNYFRNVKQTCLNYAAANSSLRSGFDFTLIQVGERKKKNKNPKCRDAFLHSLRELFFFKLTLLIQGPKLPSRILGGEDHIPVPGTHHGTCRGKVAHFHSRGEERLRQDEAKRCM